MTRSKSMRRRGGSESSVSHEDDVIPAVSVASADDEIAADHTEEESRPLDSSPADEAGPPESSGPFSTEVIEPPPFLDGGMSEAAPSTPTDSPPLHADEGADAGAAADEAAVSAVQILGFTDGLDDRGRITGWCCVPEHPSERVRLTALVDDVEVASGIADDARPDVAEAGFGDGNSGYALELPVELFDGEVHRVVVRAEAFGASIDMRALLELTPPSTEEKELAPGEWRFTPIVNPAQPNTAELPLPAYVPGQYVDCFSPNPAPAYHVSGWHDPEPEFTWIAGTEAVIEMSLRRPARSYTLHLEIVPNGRSTSLQTLEVYFNCFRLGVVEVQMPSLARFELPAELFVLRRTRINLHCSQAVVGVGIPDTRRLGIAVRRWWIE